MKARADRPPPLSRPGEAGVALLTVLWFLVALSALAVTLAALGRDTAYASRNAVRAIEVRTTMASALEIAGSSIWRGQQPDDGVLAWRQGRFAVTVTISPEGRKIDLNGAGDELIEALAAVAAEAAGRDEQAALALGHAILDWRDPDGERRLAGAEADAYARAGRIGQPRDGPFRFVAELRGVMGVDEALFDILAPAVTVNHGLDVPSLEPSNELVRKAGDRSLGLDSGLADPESSFDPDDQSLDDDPDLRSAPILIADPDGLYTLEIELVHDDGPSFRQQTVIWIDPPPGTAPYGILESRSTILPTATTGAADDDGAAAWPGR
jgi:general secretion pathway protein K